MSATTTKTMIRAERLTKRIGDSTLFSNIDLRVDSGECLGIVAANGADRSVLLRILATLVPPSSGSIDIDGIDAVRRVFAVRSRLMYFGEPSPADGGIRVREHLDLVTAVRQPDRQCARAAIEDALRRTALPGDALVDELPPRLGHRLTLASSLAAGPAVLVLDDPFGPIEPETRRVFVECLREISQRGTTVVLGGREHDIDSVCHRIVRLESGRLAPYFHSDLVLSSAAGM